MSCNLIWLMTSSPLTMRREITGPLSKAIPVLATNRSAAAAVVAKQYARRACLLHGGLLRPIVPTPTQHLKILFLDRFDLGDDVHRMHI